MKITSPSLIIAISLLLLLLLKTNTVEAKNHLAKDFLKRKFNKNGTSFMIITKECKHCQNEFRINILINDDIYLSTIVKDSMIITIPTAQLGDIITIKKFKDNRQKWDGRTIIHNRKYSFKIKNKHTVKIKSIRKYRSNYPRKKGKANHDM